MPTPDLLSDQAHVEHVLGVPVGSLNGARADRLLANGSRAFRSATEQHISRKLGTSETLDGNGRPRLLLQETPVLAVISVTEDGKLLVADTDYEWSANGILLRKGACWPLKARSVAVVYDHGYDPVPDDVQHAVAEWVAVRWPRRPGVSSLQLGATSVTYAKGGVTEDWQAAVEHYRMPR